MTAQGYHGDPKHPICNKFYYVVATDEDNKPCEHARWSKEQQMWVIQSDVQLVDRSLVDHYIVSYYMKVGW